ncbi:MAG: S1 RNA-binding domain-containing protein [Pirellulales bacterium]|nr:S1 RNA-binding domain-containing protein [Pirellulales bacterium]
MTLTDPNDQADPVEAAVEADAIQPETDSFTSETAAGSPRQRILIGSQRDPAAYRPKPRHEVKPLKRKGREARGEGRGPAATADGDSPRGPVASADGEFTEDAAAELPRQPMEPSRQTTELISQLADALAAAPAAKPSVRDRLTPEMEDELRSAMGDASMDDFLDPAAAVGQTLEAGQLQSGRVVAVRRDDVFVEFAGHQQGIAPLRLFDVPPRLGAEVQVVVDRFNAEDGLYDLSLPNKAVQVDDWSDLIEGAMVEVRVTGHNAGGLECEVNRIRGFIPVSQIDLYRVEDMAQFVDQKWTCIITEANPDRRNLVLSRRAVLERERERAKRELLDSLRPGQIREGVVRKLMDFGAFVDLGGVDGLVHVSQVAWGRVAHPADVLKEGQQVKVRVDKVDPTTGKISLAYRDLLENPWETAAQKFPPNSVAAGTVTKLMDFGAFVEVEPGIEGLVHISELSHKHIWRCSDVVKPGQQVEVMVLSVDAEAQRMSLSMKELAAPPEPAKKEDAGPGEPAVKSKKRAKPAGPLLGGLGRATGDRFGLKW